MLLPSFALFSALLFSQATSDSDDFPCPGLLSTHQTGVSSSEGTSCQKLDDDSRRERKKRQAGRAARLEGCGNPLLAEIMQNVLGQLLPRGQMRLGDTAQVLQKAVQAATGQSHEVIMGKGEMVFASHQMAEESQCRLRIGEYYTTVYQTPIGAGGGGYDVNNEVQEQELSNVDFGEPNGGSGYYGQWPWPIQPPLEALLVESDAALYGLLDGTGIAGLWPGGAAGAACFSGDLMVQTREGPKAMRELRVGDEVKSIDETLVSFSTIIMFLHRDEDMLAQFNVITTASSETVKLTDDHLIYASDCDYKSPLRLVRAKDVTNEHCLLGVRSPGGTRELVRVTNVTKTLEVGVYAPLTLTGDIIINNVLSSCHCSLPLKSLQDSLFSIYRFLNILLPEDGSLPLGLAYIINAIDLIIPTKEILG